MLAKAPQWRKGKGKEKARGKNWSIFISRDLILVSTPSGSSARPPSHSAR